MIYREMDYDLMSKSWVPSNTFKSSVTSTHKSKGYRLNSYQYTYSFVRAGETVAPSCLAAWRND